MSDNIIRHDDDVIDKQERLKARMTRAIDRHRAGGLSGVPHSRIDDLLFVITALENERQVLLGAIEGTNPDALREPECAHLTDAVDYVRNREAWKPVSTKGGES